MIAVEVGLSRWLFNAVQVHEVLTINSDYFRLRKPIERRLYELARKHCGDQAHFAIGAVWEQVRVVRVPASAPGDHWRRQRCQTTGWSSTRSGIGLSFIAGARGAWDSRTPPAPTLPRVVTSPMTFWVPFRKTKLGIKRASSTEPELLHAGLVARLRIGHLPGPLAGCAACKRADCRARSHTDRAAGRTDGSTGCSASPGTHARG